MLVEMGGLESLAPFNPKNFNHTSLRKLGLWDARDDVPLRFLKSLRRRSYFG